MNSCVNKLNLYICTSLHKVTIFLYSLNLLYSILQAVVMFTRVYLTVLSTNEISVWHATLIVMLNCKKIL